jgi:two-component system sensor histidine kinase GlrK
MPTLDEDLPRGIDLFRVTLKPMKLNVQYPRSFTALLLVAFALAAMPLLGGMLNTAFLLQEIAREGRGSVATTAKVTRATRQLVEGVNALQRAVGQYYVLEDPALLEAVTEVHRQLQGSIAALRGMPLEPAQQRALEDFAVAETRLLRELGARKNTGTGPLLTLAPQFDRLHEMAVAMIEAGDGLIDRQVAAMEKTADTAQQGMVLQGVAMVPLSLLIALLFSWLINRPVRQLASAIQRLGENDLAPAPAVNGPRDLAYLGEQIDWLRRRLIDLEEREIRFLRHVSHELKTPLAALREGVELLADRVAGELTPQQEEIAHIMRGNARDLQRRIEDLVRYSRVMQEPEPLSAVAFSLDELLGAVVQRHDLAIRSKELRIDTNTTGVQLIADKEKMMTVFDNLLSNAIRFSPNGGTVRITASAGAKWTEIVICDQGPGVPEEDRPFIFQPFYQGGVQPSGPVRGSGLGLAIVKEYVESHGGQVNLVDHPPWGACFQVMLAGSGGGT